MKLRCVLLAAALALLLAGCQAGEPEDSASPEPGPSQAVTVPSPLPETPTLPPETPTLPPETPAPPSEEPEPSPTLSPLEQLLAEQPMDDDHDAFLVDTKGKLGTLLVTVERGEQDAETEFGECHYTLSVWNPADMDGPIQTFEEKACTFGSPYLMDANFDGYLDCCLEWNWFSINANYSLYIWDEAQGRLAFGGAFVSHGGPFPSEKTQTIRSYIHYTNASGVYEVYHWEDGELVCVREVERCSPSWEDDIQDLAVRDLIGGEMKEIYRETFDLTSSIFDEEEKWLDLDYHGE